MKILVGFIRPAIKRVICNQVAKIDAGCVADRDLLAAQEFAGHARPDTTRRYTRVNVRRLTEAVYAINYEEDQEA